MFVSGTLKNKTIDFYREKMICFDEKSFDSDVLITYNGEVAFAPWDYEKEQKIALREEMYIREFIKKILDMSIIKGRYSNSNINKITILLEKIKKTNRNLTYKLLEILKNILINNYNIPKEIYNFEKFIEYLEKQDNLNQIDLDIICSIYIRNLGVSIEKVREQKIKTFGINEDNLSYEMYKIALLGEFIAPFRVYNVASALMREEEYSKYIVPIYFAIKDDKEAIKFINSCKTYDLDLDKIEKNAKLCRVPKNLVEMVRR